MTRAESFEEFLAVTAEDASSGLDLAEDAFYAGWEAGWEHAQQYFATGGTFR